MSSHNVQITKNSIASEAFQRMGLQAALLMKQGASLRLLSALLCLQNYASIYKLIIDKHVQKGSRRRPTRAEQERLIKWEQDNPALARAMSERKISPRRWCYYYDLVMAEDIADIFALTHPESYEYNHNRPVLSYLHEDFPSAFGIKAKYYWAAEVNPDLYFDYMKSFSNGKTRHIFWNDDLKIKVINNSYHLAYNIFTKRLMQEIRYCRMKGLLDWGLSSENIKYALEWLPITKPKDQSNWHKVNNGEGHLAMRSAEAKNSSASWLSHTF